MLAAVNRRAGLTDMREGLSDRVRHVYPLNYFDFENIVGGSHSLVSKQRH